MSSLADSNTPPLGARGWALRIMLGLLAVALVVGGALGLKSWLGKPAAQAQKQARITILPDTPPPPPPPPPKEKPPEPKDAPKPTPQAEAPKPVDAPRPADAPLKMDGPAGDGPSAFQAGAVTQDYKGGPPVLGGSGGGAARPAADRAQARLWAGSARQLLLADLERRYGGDAQQLVADFNLWVASDGALQRYELQPTGDSRRDGELRQALDQTVQALRLPPPPDIAQPLRFRLTIRNAG